MNITLEDFAAMWPAMPQEMREALIASTAKEIAAGFHESVLQEIGCFLGRKAALPLSLASRITGFDVKWIRRNLPVIKAEGQIDSIQLGDLVEAMEKRKDK